MPEFGPHPESDQSLEPMEAKLPASAATKQAVVTALDSHLNPGEGDRSAHLVSSQGEDVDIDAHAGEHHVSIMHVTKAGAIEVDSEGSASELGHAAITSEGYHFSPTDDSANPWDATKTFYRGGDAYEDESGSEKPELTEADAKKLLSVLSEIGENR